MHRFLAILLSAGLWPAVAPAAAATQLTMAPPPDTHLAVGQRFDVRIAADAPLPAPPRVTLDGVPLAPVSAAGQAWVVRQLELRKAGVHRLEVTVTGADGTVAARGSRELVAEAWPAPPRQAARNVILLIGDGMGLAHRVAARLFLHGVVAGRPGALLAMEQLPVAGFLATSSLSGLVTDSAAAAHAMATGTKTANGLLGVFPDETPEDSNDNAAIEELPSLLARRRGMVSGVVTTADVTDATPAGFLAHAADRGSAELIARGELAAASAGYLRILLGGGRRHFAAAGGALLGAFRQLGFATPTTAAELEASVAGGAERILGLFHDSHMNTAFDLQRRGDPEVIKNFPEQPTLEVMTRAALAVLARHREGFFLLVEGAHIDRQAHIADQERMVWEVLAFDRAVAAAVAFANTSNSDADPGNDTLVIVTADHETGGVVLPGMGDAAHLGTREYLQTYDAGGLPPTNDADGDGFPDSVDGPAKVVIHFGACPDRYEDWQSQPRPVPPALGRVGRDRFVHPNPERDGGRGVLLGGVTPVQVPAEGYAPTQCVHTAVDVPLSALGPGAEQLAGVKDNTQVFFAILRAVGEPPPAPGKRPER
ncbi:MAG: alkaline phosphatase [Thermoanaerobaculaceae bacterium]|nr:alkaline phosphatase [Thermoanaerobaculaceae bacterium]